MIKMSFATVLIGFFLGGGLVFSTIARAEQITEGFGMETLSQVGAVVVSIDPWTHGPKRVTRTAETEPAFSALIDLIVYATPCGDHKCRNSGTVVLEFSGRRPLKLGLLAGHKPLHHQIRVYSSSSYRVLEVSKAKLRKVLAGLGVDVSNPDFPL